MEIIAHIDDVCFLVEVPAQRGYRMVRVLDCKRKILHSPTPLDSVMARCPYYEPYTGSQDRLPDLLRDVEDRPGEWPFPSRKAVDED